MNSALARVCTRSYSVESVCYSITRIYCTFEPNRNRQTVVIVIQGKRDKKTVTRSLFGFDFGEHEVRFITAEHLVPVHQWSLLVHRGSRTGGEGDER